MIKHEENMIPNFFQKKINVQDKILNERIIKSLLFSGFITYLLLLIENIILASFFGYNILTNYISELGKSSIIPFPFLNDGVSILGGIITVFCNFYFVRKLKTQYRPSQCSKVFVKLGFISGIIGAVGYIFLGIFSLDRAGPGEWYHGASMGFSFGGFIFSIFFYSLNLVLTHECNLKKVGLYGITFPLICFAWYALTNNPLAEWISLYSILVFYLLILK
ncbi:MAG: hypothetical protein ACTSV5_13105 [Promethearchaeota archaeon]